MTQQKTDYEALTTGYEFAPAEFQLDNGKVTAYLKAIESEKLIYEEENIVPPMVIAALAMTAMSAGLSLPSGAIHVSQELQFLGKVSTTEDLTSFARVKRKVERGKFHMLTIGINVLNKKQTTVLTGETSFILPLS